MKNEEIDFVVLWVDGSDPEWVKEKMNYKQDKNEHINGAIRFRDWDLLKYWFRGVEKYAPWVHKIYFVTWGHLPSFLNTDNDKVVIVNHQDYIEKKYLPTFNSNVLDLNLMNINELSEKFVYFNDDMFLIDDVKKSDFFKGDLPKDEYTESAIVPTEPEFPHNLLNNIYIINKHYKKRKWENFSKKYNYKYGLKNILKTFCCSFYKNYVGFYNPHIPQAFLKSDFERLWELEKDLCIQTSSNKFRTRFDITQYLIRNIRLVTGQFEPRSSKFGKNFPINDNNQKAIEAIKKQKYKMICLNDVTSDFDFDKAKNELIDAFESILPEKSSFEK